MICHNGRAATITMTVTTHNWWSVPVLRRPTTAHHADGGLVGNPLVIAARRQRVIAHHFEMGTDTLQYRCQQDW